MNLPTHTHIKQNFRVLWDVAKLKPGSTRAFETKEASLSRSFSLAPFLFPIFFFMMMNLTFIFDRSVSTTAIAYGSLLLYSTLWTMFPIVLHTLGIRENLRQYVIARNWLLIANLLITLFANLGGPFAMIGFFAGLYILVMDWFIIKDALNQTTGKAVTLAIIQVVLNGCLTMYFLLTMNVDFDAYIASARAAAGG